jgi:hypothetical protein
MFSQLLIVILPGNNGLDQKEDSRVLLGFPAIS